MQLNFILEILSDAVAFTRVDAPVSHELAAPGLFLQGMAAAICLSNFLVAFMMMSLYSSSSGPMEKYLSDFWHCQVSVSRLPTLVLLSLSSFPEPGPRFRPYMIWTCSRLIFCQSPPDHIFPFGGVSFNRVNFVKPFHESDKLVSSSTFQ